MSRGGKREGAGRPMGSTMSDQLKRNQYSTRLPLWLINWLKGQSSSQSQVIEDALIKTHKLKTPKK